jgi:hypothetical protein
VPLEAFEEAGLEEQRDSARHAESVRTSRGSVSRDRATEGTAMAIRAFKLTLKEQSILWRKTLQPSNEGGES